MSESRLVEQTQRVALVIQYQGTHFHGWQWQPNYRSVQEEIEKAISTVAGHRVTLHGAGRTDSGVHAAAQVAHFNIVSRIPPSKWASILNGYLPEGILIRASAGVNNDWHARFSASYRRYRYTLYNEKLPNLFVKSFSWHYYQAPIDENLILAALKPLIGKHHLSAFHRANSGRKHSWVNVQDVECYRRGGLVHIEIQADGFLYGMVRLLVGMLVQVATKKRTVENFTQI
ncbi:MAG: tRNA pseudouridine(38-40) synthase TruA, partial [Cyanobacteria bacterium J06649_11]